jgi:hypothetical protein
MNACTKVSKVLGYALRGVGETEIPRANYHLMDPYTSDKPFKR